MAWSHVQDAPGSPAMTNTGGALTLTVTAFGSPNTIGNQIVAVVTGVDNASGVSTDFSCTDNAATPNTYTQVLFSCETTTSFSVAIVWVATIASLPVSGNLAVKFTATVSTQMFGCASEYSGGTKTVDGGSGVGYNTHTSSTSSANPTPGSITTVTDGDLIISALSSNHTSNTAITQPSGFSLIGKQVAGATYNQEGAAAYLIQTSHGTTNQAWTCSAARYACGQVALQAATTTSYTLTAALGAFTETGEPATFGIGLPVALGVFAETGQAVVFAANATLTAALGVFTESGQTATPAVSLPLVLGAFTETGQAATFAAAANLTAALGPFTETGESATYAAAVPVALGVFAETGEPVAYAVGLPVTVGVFTLAGEPVVFAAQATLVAALGAYSLTGEDASLSPGGFVLSLDVGIYALIGEDVAFVGPAPTPVVTTPTVPSTALNETSGTAGGYAVPTQWLPTGWLAGEPGSAPYYPPPLPPVRRTIVELTGEAEPGGFGLAGSGVSFARHSPAPPAPTRTEKIPGGRQVPTRRVKPLPRPPRPRSYRLASARGTCRVRGLAAMMTVDDTRFRQLQRLDDLLVLRGFDTLAEAEQEVFRDE